MRRLLSFIFVFGFIGAVYTQDDIVAKFESREHSFNATSIPYRLFIPENYDSANVYPLVLALHGAGERGTDNLLHIQLHRLATLWADFVNTSGLKNGIYYLKLEFNQEATSFIKTCIMHH